MKSTLTIFTLLIPTIAVAQFDLSPISFLNGLTALLLLALIFLTLREVMMWYWKINTIIENQAEQIKSQQETNNLLTEQIKLMKDYYRSDPPAVDKSINLDRSED